MSAAYEAAKAVVDRDKTNFDAWSQLLTAAESENIDTIRSTFDEFLERFPFTYGYWEKYAAAERRVGEADGATAQDKANAIKAATSIYERSAAAVPYSADMWLNYCKHAATHFVESPATIENVFQRALEHVKYDPRCADVWRELIKFRVKTQGQLAALRVYEQVLQLPVPYASKFMEEYANLAAGVPPEQLAPQDERNMLSVTITDYDSLAPPQQTQAMQQAIIGARRAKHDVGNAERAARMPFETTLAARWYFHVTPVDVAQLGTWRRYLDWAEKQQDAEKYTSVFERCVIVTATMSEFWLRYAAFLKKKNDEAGSLQVLQRGAKSLGASDPRVAMELALALERADRIVPARETYEALQKASTTPVLEAVMNHCNFERRCGNGEAAVRVLQRALAQTSDAAAGYVAVQLARLEHKLGGAKRARVSYRAAADRVAHDLSFWRSYVAFETQNEAEETEGVDVDVVTRVSALFRKALGVTQFPLKEGERPPPASKLTGDEQLALWGNFQAFIENHGSKIADVDGVRGEYDRWKLGVGAGAVAAAKRARPDGLATQGAAKKARTGPAPAAAAAMYAGYYGGAAAAGYGAAAANPYAAYGGAYAGYPGYGAAGAGAGYGAGAGGK